MSQDTPLPAHRKFVRVTGCRGANLIEFDFAVGSPELFVELILPEPAFAEFCRTNDVTVLPAGEDGEGQAEGGHDALHWRLRDAVLKSAGH